ncbi:MAG TPA: CRISPR system precrRNA processing endoribonuclease RAMP protein Cas6 [Chloroflexota bacterium]|nr:CRISPR system precrRNA processing endoribonuclease RAMP protein Cas6 [Chloroflexota bacterium]
MVTDPRSPALSDRLEILWLRATLAAAGEGRLPEALAPTIHGALGRALKLTACVLPDPLEQPCANCALLDRCPYPPLVEPHHRPKDGQTPTAALLAAPMVPAPRTLTLGGLIGLELALVGRSIHGLPLLLNALARMARSGIGPMRVRCAVVRVDALNAAGQAVAAVQVGDELNGQTPSPLLTAAWAARGALSGGQTRVRVNLQSGLCLKREGGITTRPPTFAELIRALSRRADALARVYCGEESAFPDPRPWLGAAESVRVADARVTWERRERRSASTGQTMPLEGMIGWIDYAADGGTLDAFLPLLFLGEALGVGRGCAFGQGRYRLRFPGARNG